MSSPAPGPDCTTANLYLCTTQSRHWNVIYSYIRFCLKVEVRCVQSHFVTHVIFDDMYDNMSEMFDD